MISHKHKCIFIHIPRTGGTTIESLLPDGLYEGHNTLQGYKHKVGSGGYEHYYKFAFVRNPWDKMLSEYFWFRNVKYAYPDEEVKQFFRKSASCFSEFVSLFFKTTVGDPTHRMCQLDFLNPVCELDYIGRFERYAEDFMKISTYIGIDIDVCPHENNISHRPYWEYYNDETRKIVAEKYAKDIEYFGYEFGED
jgi:chondroitin 4-sulfotransferase 11